MPLVSVVAVIVHANKIIEQLDTGYNIDYNMYITHEPLWQTFD